MLVLLVLIVVATGVSCKREGTGNVSDEQATNNNLSATDETLAVPPFQTKEPERYQAKRISSLSNTELLIARDGEKRREEYALGTGEKVVSLQLPEGIYLLYPSKKLYAELRLDGGNSGGDAGRSLPADFSPDKLLNQSLGGARYEKLGAEDVNGRATVKYRVTMTGKTGEAKSVKTESLIWIDESLGMPVRSETSVTGEGVAGAKYSTELRDIRLDVDQSLFELPADYRKVDYKDILR